MINLSYIIQRLNDNAIMIKSLELLPYEEAAKEEAPADPSYLTLKMVCRRPCDCGLGFIEVTDHRVLTESLSTGKLFSEIFGNFSFFSDVGCSECQ